jgi:hypothetical protein
MQLVAKIVHRFRALLLIIMVSLSNTVVNAAELNPQSGKLDPSIGGVLEGFENDPMTFTMTAFDQDEQSVSDTIAAQKIIALKEGLEGNNALRFPANWRKIRLSFGAQASQFLGNRVEIRFWTQAAGIKLIGRLAWTKEATVFSSIHFNPTGRRMDDGWIEMSSGPVDFYIAQSIQIGHIDIINEFFQYPLQNQSIDQSQYAWLDAIEIIPVGELLVSHQSCQAVSEKEQCGDGGSCFLGQCVDSAFVWGNVPNDSIREQTIDRFINQNRHIVGIRKSQHNFENFRQQMLALNDAQYGQDYWQGIQDALQELEDGHLNIPIAASSIHPNVGFCINAGLADLLPVEDEQKIYPMVFNQHTLTNGVELQPGDILWRIDGIDPQQWAQQTKSPHTVAPGDKRSRLAYQYHILNQTLAQTGAVVDFRRCVDPSGCDENSTIDFQVNFSDILAERYWAGNFESNMFENGFCDYRFDQGAPIQISDQAFADQMQVTQHDHYTEIQFTSFKSPHSSPAWTDGIDEALKDAPEQVLIDHRSGWGGSPGGLSYFLDYLIGNEDYQFLMTMPWYETFDEEAIIQQQELCTDAMNGDIFGCGWVWRFNQGKYLAEPPSKNSRVAFVTAWGLSGSDFMLRIMQERSGPTRTFGSSTFPGGYGTTSYIPSLINEIYPARVQMQDVAFQFKQKSLFESGYGATPEEIVLQKQSDAIQGVDSIIQAATAWLNQSKQGE